VPRYSEINPAIFTTVTFPFFFGVMFGDMGHGLILFLLGLYLVFNNAALAKSSMSFVCQLRYMVLMMGFFAFYCGWIYNDFLGMNVNFLGSCYPLSIRNDGEMIYTHTQDCVYPFGVDPIWGVSSNNLIFVNSLKMKVSVIIAIIHMVVGVILKCFNAVYFKRKLEIWFEFVPQILFLGLLFGYMDFLIIFKWLKFWNLNDLAHPPPSIISTMMDIGLKTGSTVSL
jgi:V-type H+-transporting ATPase subunit a